jgi:hypothetical protein
MLSKTTDVLEHQDLEEEELVWDFLERPIPMGNDQVIECLYVQNPEKKGSGRDLYFLPVYPILDGASSVLCLFLASKDDLGENAMNRQIDRGFFSLNLIYDVPKRFLEKGARRFNNLEGTLSLVQRVENTEVCLCTFQHHGSEKIDFKLPLSAGLSRQILKAIDGSASSLFFKSSFSVRFKQAGLVRHITSYLSLAKFLKLKDLIGKPVRLNIFYKYFDSTSGQYLDAPELFETRGISRKIEKKSVSVLVENKLLSTQMNMAAGKITVVSPWNLAHAGNFDSRINLFKLDHWQINLNDQILDLPLIDDSSATFWVSRKNSTSFLSIPDFSIVAPELNSSFEASPFSFKFYNTGQLDLNGKSVLEGELKLTINHRVSDAAVQAQERVAAGGVTQEIQTEQIVYNLNIPYADSQGKDQFLTISTQEIKLINAERTELIFRFGNDSVRLCYAMIASDNNLSVVKKAELFLTLYFKGYTQVRKHRLDLTQIVGAKLSAIPFIKSRASINRDQDYFDAARNKLVKTSGQEIVFKDAVAKLTRSRQIRPAFIASNFNNSFIRAEKIQAPALNFVQPTKLEPLIEKATYVVQTFVRNISVACYFPCNVFGNYYQEANDGNWTIVGCKPAYRLGEPPDTLYTEIEALRHPKYALYRSRLSPNNFLIVPAGYVIARYEPTIEDKKFKPCIFLYSTLNEVDNTSSWVLDMTLVPDLTLAERSELDQALKEYTPYPPELNYITEIQTKVSEGSLSISKMPGTQVLAFPLQKDIRVTIQTNIESILILLEMLKNNAMIGSFQFTQLDDIKHVVELKPVLNHVAGTWTSGHFEITKIDHVLSFTNHTEARITMEKIRFYLDGQQAFQDMIRTDVVEAGGVLTLDITSIPAYHQVVPYYVVEQANISLEQINKYIEDVTCQLIFIASCDFDTLEIEKLNLKYRLKDASTEYSVVLTRQDNNAEAEFLLPLTVFLIERVVEYKIESIEKTNSEVKSQPDHWTLQDISVDGNIINITSNQIINN